MRSLIFEKKINKKRNKKKWLQCLVWCQNELNSDVKILGGGYVYSMGYVYSRVYSNLICKLCAFQFQLIWKNVMSASKRFIESTKFIPRSKSKWQKILCEGRTQSSACGKQLCPDDSWCICYYCNCITSLLSVFVICIMISQKPRLVWIKYILGRQQLNMYYIPDLIDLCEKTFRVNLTERNAVEVM